MCGIAGVLAADGTRAPAFHGLARMAAMLHHRGPDGHGYYRDTRIGLVHTRLSLLDLDGGHQPLTNETGTVWVVGNGEIFGHASLREELQQRGHRFHTGSDIEVVVHAYEQWGEAAWARLDGQFAFALWDAGRRHLWLVRDRLGILPLFYRARSHGVAFASEVKALLAAEPTAPVVDPAGLLQVFTFWAAIAPRSLFAGVQSVLPGEAVRFDESLRAQATRWWQWTPRVDDDAPTSLAEASAGLRRRLDAAVELRLRADVPVGTYLSGGLDSAVITALAARRGSHLHTFALRFAEPAFDETDAQRRVASLLGTEHHELLIDDRAVGAALPDVVWHCETPLLRTAPVPMFLLSGLVRAAGIKAVLTGEGADELLAGYSIFQEDRVRRFWARAAASRRRPALFARVHDFVGTASQRGGPMWQEFYRRGLLATGDRCYSHAIRWHNTAWTMRVLAPELRTAAAADLPAGAIAAQLPPDFDRCSALGRAQALEAISFLSPYLLASQGDRVALGHGVEVRYPFLDPDVVAFCGGLPDACKMRGLHNKLALRSLAAELLPVDVWRRAKRPYRAPTASALLGARRPSYVDELLAPAALRRNELLDADAATALVQKARRSEGRALGEREAMALTGTLTLQLFRDLFLTGFTARVDEALRRFGHRRPTVQVDASSSAPSPA